METDIASRGIDVLSISHTINYDIQDSTEDYIHRIGRTGRADRNEEALSFVTEDDTVKIRTIEHLPDTHLRRVTFNKDLKRVSSLRLSLIYKQGTPVLSGIILKEIYIKFFVSISVERLLEYFLTDLLT